MSVILPSDSDMCGDTLLELMRSGNVTLVKNYTLNQKRAMEKIAENTKIPNLVLNKQTSCISIQMSSGAYQVAALGLLRSVSGEKVVEYKERKAVCTKSEPRFDANSSLVESLLTFSLDDNVQFKVTLNFYHTTQKILVQGTAAVPFTDSILVPLFETNIKECKEEI